jgi:predicted ATP-grasp superfamily ATP-dependent carboligase
MIEQIGVIGASARAAVMSLARAGYSAWAVDLFADRDLKRLAPCVRCPVADYPENLPRLAHATPTRGGSRKILLYTGGLENDPDVVAELARGLTLWGNGPDVLKRIRDPFELFTECLRISRDAESSGRSAPIRALRVAVNRMAGLPHVGEAGRWLVKSRRSSGGLGVRWAMPGEVALPGSYLQEFIPGTPMSAVYLGARLLGVTEQLVGTPWLHAQTFRYAGTLAPAPLPAAIQFDLAQLGRDLVASFGLTGLFGVDFILRDGAVWILEVNPRYPASVEVLEFALGLAAFAKKARPAGAADPTGSGKGVVAKGVYFAPRGLRFPDSGPWDADLAGPFDPWRLPNFADIPDPGEPIEAGSPVLTFFASGTTVDKCRRCLQSQAADLDRLFQS